MDHPEFCPYCGKREVVPDECSAFVEMGEWDGNTYEVEGDAQTMKCQACGRHFAVFDYDPSDFKQEESES